MILTLANADSALKSAYLDVVAKELDYGVNPFFAELKKNTNNIVGITSGGRSQVVFKKLDKFEEVAPVADVLKERKIVILNLETCPNDVAKRVIDFLYGVTYAISGEIKRVAGRAYIIAPNNVPVTGELLDEIENGSMN